MDGLSALLVEKHNPRLVLGMRPQMHPCKGVPVLEDGDAAKGGAPAHDDLPSMEDHTVEDPARTADAGSVRFAEDGEAPGFIHVLPFAFPS